MKKVNIIPILHEYQEMANNVRNVLEGHEVRISDGNVKLGLNIKEHRDNNYGIMFIVGRKAEEVNSVTVSDSSLGMDDSVDVKIEDLVEYIKKM